VRSQFTRGADAYVPAVAEYEQLTTQLSHAAPAAADSDVVRCYAYVAPTTLYCRRANTIAAYVRMHRELPVRLCDIHLSSLLCCSLGSAIVLLWRSCVFLCSAHANVTINMQLRALQRRLHLSRSICNFTHSSRHNHRQSSRPTCNVTHTLQALPMAPCTPGPHFSETARSETSTKSHD
jgi:hypothetical protein